MKKYLTKQGDTWDMIALKFWPDIGGEKLMGTLLEFNAPLRHRVVFSSGTEIFIPDVDIPAVATRPPWRR